MEVSDENDLSFSVNFFELERTKPLGSLIARGIAHPAKHNKKNRQFILFMIDTNLIFATPLTAGVPGEVRKFIFVSQLDDAY